MQDNNWCTGFCHTCGTGCCQYCDEIQGLKDIIACQLATIQWLKAGGAVLDIEQPDETSPKPPEDCL